MESPLLRQQGSRGFIRSLIRINACLRRLVNECLAKGRDQSSELPLPLPRSADVNASFPATLEFRRLFRSDNFKLDAKIFYKVTGVVIDNIGVA